MDRSRRVKYIVWTYPDVHKLLEAAVPLIERGSGYPCRRGPYLIPADHEDQTVPNHANVTADSTSKKSIYAYMQLNN